MIKMPNRQSGLTLVELMISVGVGIVLLSIAVPKMFSVLDHNTLVAASNSLVQSLHLARSEAIRGGGATLCASTDTKVCSGNAADWKSGWIVQDSTNTTVRVYPGIAPEVISIAASTASVSYRNNGFLTPVGTVTIDFCKARKKTDHAVVTSGTRVSITTSGKPRSEKFTCP